MWCPRTSGCWSWSTSRTCSTSAATRFSTSINPGRSSPPPHVPYFKGPEALAAYLSQRGIHYLAFVLGASSPEYNYPVWRGRLDEVIAPGARGGMYKAQARFYIDAFDSFSALAKTRRVLARELLGARPRAADLNNGAQPEERSAAGWSDRDRMICSCFGAYLSREGIRSSSAGSAALESLLAFSLREGVRTRERLFGVCRDDLLAAAVAVRETVAGGNRILLCGNGGSAADAQHIAAELVGRFVRERAPLPAIALTVDSSILTAIGNDYGFEQIFARQVTALGAAGDLLVAVGTSGRSPNVIAACQEARARGLKVVGLTGETGDRLADVSDVCIRVPSRNTARIQECHLTIGHLF